MSEVTYITTMQNPNTSTSSYSNGGLVLVVGTSEVSGVSEFAEILTITPVWVQTESSYFTSYSTLVSALLSTGVIYGSSFLPVGTLALSLPFSGTMISSEIINTLAEILLKTKHFDVKN